ncbi:MAG TPA: DinB family protein [Dehalococcoidia bacterium]
MARGTDTGNAMLAEVFRYNRWANEQTIAKCRTLTDEQLDAGATGTFGSIRQTLQHVIDSQRTQLARLRGMQRDPAIPDWSQWPGFDELAAVATSSSEALIAAAEALTSDSDVTLPYLGKSYRFPKSFVLTHAIVHGIEHRTQIGVMLSTLGVAPPDLDGWPYASAAGYGTEV